MTLRRVTDRCTRAHLSCQPQLLAGASRASLRGVPRYPSQPPASQHLTASTQQGHRALPGLQSKSQSWHGWEDTLTAVPALREGGDRRERSILQARRSSGLWRTSGQQILKTPTFYRKEQFPREDEQRHPSAERPRASSQPGCRWAVSE